MVAPANHPVQTNYSNSQAEVSQLVTRRAYEVYRHVYGEQPALITGDCRSGFSAGELIAFLYARSFPQTEWAARAVEAMRGMRNL